MQRESRGSSKEELLPRLCRKKKTLIIDSIISVFYVRTYQAASVPVSWLFRAKKYQIPTVSASSQPMGMAHQMPTSPICGTADRT